MKGPTYRKTQTGQMTDGQEDRLTKIDIGIYIIEGQTVRRVEAEKD